MGNPFKRIPHQEKGKSTDRWERLGRPRKKSERKKAHTHRRKEAQWEETGKKSGWALVKKIPMTRLGV